VDVTRLEALPAVLSVRQDNGDYLIHSNDVAATLTALMRFSGEGSFSVQNLQVRTATLEDVFISLTGRRLRD
jgi:ABC-2 type transport system ATP-binding protein